MADPVFDRLTNADITEALAIQSRLYPPALVESEAVFLNRISLSASHCLCARKAGCKHQSATSPSATQLKLIGLLIFQLLQKRLQVIR